MPPTTYTSGDSVPLSILVVDDFRDAADSLADLLRLCGHGVQTAYDASTALAAERPDVVILEVRLRDGGDWELMRQMRERFVDRQPRYIAVTTCGLAQERQRSETLGIDFHLLKPVEPGVLMDVLKQLAETDARIRDVSGDLKTATRTVVHVDAPTPELNKTVPSISGTLDATGQRIEVTDGRLADANKKVGEANKKMDVIVEAAKNIPGVEPKK